MGHQIRAAGATTVVGALLGAALLGCTTNRQDPDAPAGVPNRIVEQQGGAEVALEGQVAEIDGCFYIEGPEPDNALTLAIFPAHEVAEASDGEGFSYLGEDYADGDDIFVGGNMAGPTIYGVPEVCDEDIQQWRVNSSTEIP